MKIQHQHFVRDNERGVATIIFVVLMLLMLALVMAEGSALFQLRREVKMLEQKQIKRLDISQTNSIAVTRPESK